MPPRSPRGWRRKYNRLSSQYATLSVLHYEALKAKLTEK